MVTGHARSLNEKKKKYEFIFKFQCNDKECVAQENICDKK